MVHDVICKLTTMIARVLIQIDLIFIFGLLYDNLT